MFHERVRQTTNVFTVFFVALLLWQLAPYTNALGYASRFVGFRHAMSLLPGASPGTLTVCTLIALVAVYAYLGALSNVRTEEQGAGVSIAFVAAALALPPIAGYGQAALTHTYLTASLEPYPMAYERTTGDRFSHRLDGLPDNRGIIIGWNSETYIVLPLDVKTGTVQSSIVSFVSKEKSMIDDVEIDSLRVR